MTNPSLKRSWLQTAGLPLRPVEQAVRNEIDRMDRAQLLTMTNRVMLLDADGAPIGVLDLNPESLERIKAADEQPAERQPDPAAGDTVIRKLDPGDPLAALAQTGPRFIDDAEAPPPLDLPDFHRPQQHVTAFSGRIERARQERHALNQALVIMGMIIAALIIAALSIYIFTAASAPA